MKTPNTLAFIFLALATSITASPVQARDIQSYGSSIKGGEKYSYDSKYNGENHHEGGGDHTHYKRSTVAGYGDKGVGYESNGHGYGKGWEYTSYEKDGDDKPDSKGYLKRGDEGTQYGEYEGYGKGKEGYGNEEKGDEVKGEKIGKGGY